MPEPLDYATPLAREDRRVVYWRPRINIPLALFCVYAPYAWLLFIDYNWRDGYRLSWLKMWPILPGLLAMLLGPRGSWAWENLVMAGATAGILAVVLIPFCRARRRRTILILAAVLLGLSGVNAFVAYLIFLD